jgi:nucleotide-binding universal stress UspA family protein
MEAIKLAGGNAAKLRLIHIVNTAVVAVDYAAGVIGPVDISEKLRANGEAVIKQAEDVVSRNGMHSETVILGTAVDNTGELIVNQASEWPADVIVMGTHGRRGLARLILGSNAEYVLRHTPVPVLIVRKTSKE